MSCLRVLGGNVGQGMSVQEMGDMPPHDLLYRCFATGWLAGNGSIVWTVIQR